jgi:hypothetical protein
MHLERMQASGETTYRLLSNALGSFVRETPALTIALTHTEARIRTTLGETVTVDREDFIRLVHWILRDKERAGT